MSSLIPTIARPDHCSETLNLLTIAQPTFSLTHINNGCAINIKNYVISPTRNCVDISGKSENHRGVQNFKFKLNSIFSNFRNTIESNKTKFFKFRKWNKCRISSTPGSTHKINKQMAELHKKRTSKKIIVITSLKYFVPNELNSHVISFPSSRILTPEIYTEETLIKNLKLSPLLLSPNISMSIMNLMLIILSIHTEDKINKKHELNRKKLTTLSRFFVFTLSTNPKKENKFLQHESCSFLNHIKGMVKIRNQGFFMKEYG